MKPLLALLAMAAAFLTGPAQAAPQGTPVTEEDAYAIGLEAYTYAYPMVLMEVTRRVSTNAGEGRLHAPMNHFSHMKTYPDRSEEHTSELQSLMRISYAVFCLKKKNT